MLCYVMLCYVMLCYVMLCYVMSCHVMSCYVMSCHVYVMPFYIMFMSFDVKVIRCVCIHTKETPHTQSILKYLYTNTNAHTNKT